MNNLNPTRENMLRSLISYPTGKLFSELQPYKMGSDLFNYHLKHLLKDNLIEKINDLYKLTIQGQKFTEEIYPVSIIRPIADKYKLYSHGIIFKKDSDELMIINRRRKKQPFYGDLGILGASVRKGETSEIVLRRRLRDQPEIEVLEQNMKYAGTIRKINLDNNKDLFSDVIMNIYFCSTYEGEIVYDKWPHQDVLWVSIDEAIKNEETSQNSMDYLVEILKQLKTKQYTEIIPSYSEQIQVHDFSGDSIPSED
ncbi:MAG: hypothetical protein Q9M91_04995 [Candidatus Dojkabacteria bacterium]|nr:hypothetical protein [Candidatus Dojkabacteria bacterium]MDQ7021164.1 hypothetical protein [Candidatus Dojkabacteria bacterium]